MENRESFFARINPFMAPSDLLKVEFAYMMAKFGHRFQFRKEMDKDGNPLRYFDHPRRVAIIIIDEVHIREPEMICSALLHDCLEDTKDISAQMIEQLFGKEVVRNVKLLSKLPKEGYYERLQNFGDWKVWALKCADRLDNLRSLQQTSKEFQDRQLKETREVIYPMIKNLINMNAEVGHYFQYEIHNIVDTK